MSARLLAAATVVLVGGCVPAVPAAAPTAGGIGATRALLLDPGAPFWSARAPDSFRARFHTARGDFDIEARRAWSPRGVDRFWQLVRAGFFDDSRFFRVRAGYIAQFGLPGDPHIAALWRNRTIPDDTVPAPSSNARGYVAYAMTGPGTRTTQVYINLRDNAPLDAQGFLPIGRVVAGMAVVDSLYSGYGEAAGGGMRAGQQDSLFAAGNAWLDRAFPSLDRILSARVIGP